MKIFQAVLVKANYRYFTLVWALLIVIVSTIPYLPQPEITTTKGFSLRLDYFFHFMVYFVLAFLATIWQVNQKIKFPHKRLLVFLIAGVFFAFLDEWHQILVPGRRYNPLDFFSNAAGFICGILFTYYYLLQYLVVKKNKLKAVAGKLFRQQ